MAQLPLAMVLVDQLYDLAKAQLLEAPLILTTEGTPFDRHWYGSQCLPAI